MSCGGCVATVKSKLSAATGVTSVQIDLAKKQAEIKADTLQKALKDTHYTITEPRTA